MKRVVVNGTAILFLAACVRLFLLPVATTETSPNARTYRGVMHVHSNASHDAKQTAEDIAADAKKDGLDFVVFTDHNKKNGEPRYEDGVLLLPETEWSLQKGHVIALGGNAISEATVASGPNWPALEKSGAFLYGAHPDSRKNPLPDAAFEHLRGDEVLSSSSDFYAGMGAWIFLLTYPLRPTLALSALYPDRARGIDRYERLSTDASSGGRELGFFCGADDHGWTHRPERLETYVTYVPRFFPEKDASTDATLLRSELEDGAFYCALGLFGDASPLSVTVTNGAGIGTFGAHVAMPAKLRVRWNAKLPDGHKYFLYREGEEVFSTSDKEFEFPLDNVGRYRLEVERTTPAFFGVRHVRWIYGNPIFVEPGAA